MSIKVDIVTPEKMLYSGDVEMITLPGTNGQMGILRGHAPLLSTLDIGEIVLHSREGNEYLAVSGGVVEVRPDKVTILADVAEAGTEIDEDRAAAALERARQSLAENPPPQQVPEIMASLRRSSLRLKVARRHAGRRSTSGLNYEGGGESK
ncbi:MAG: F0F1 ATP synthase subunit epsilon [Caldilinea sp.]|nr:F0F1 ATP synthase subunit epsilon [Caldilineaceae bacterium]MCB9119763.1 F0F1 ATP synthase subunit epsilon [Caldilineaceae bacterium]MCO5211442.1 F0F1 ATP synthase subunit epsilon [Caldilinea sp.]MCW5842858.1 F0F1 ATP synthase subunit epsilon [Caldilinea sp.]